MAFCHQGSLSRLRHTVPHFLSFLNWLTSCVGKQIQDVVCSKLPDENNCLNLHSIEKNHNNQPGDLICGIRLPTTLSCFVNKIAFQIEELKSTSIGLPWWCSGWESAYWCRGHGFEPWSEKIPHATEQLGPWATITEPARLEPVLRNKRGRDSERPTYRNEEWPPLAAAGGSPRTETKTQHRQK